MDVVYSYIADYGSWNNVVGHRRWLLHPNLKQASSRAVGCAMRPCARPGCCRRLNGAHRARPSRAQVGTGDVPLVLGAADATGKRVGAAGNAIYFLDSAVNNFYGARAATRNTWVAWPPAGYVPHTVVTGA